MKKQSLLGLMMITVMGLTSCSSISFPSFTPSAAEKPAPSAHTGTYNTALWEGGPTDVWSKLEQQSSAKLTAMQNDTADPEQKAWIQLALISKHNSTNTPQLARALIAWREQNPGHPANTLLPSDTTLNQLQTTPPPQHIAILLPQHGPYASSGQTVREGFLNAYYANLSKMGNQSVKFYDTATSNDMAALYQQAISEGADFIIGPLTKENVQQLSRSGSFNAPTLALNYTDISWGSLPTNFYEFGLLPEDELTQMANRARSDGSSRAIVIAPATAWGKRMVSAFSNRWESAGGNIQQTWYYSANTNFNQEIAKLLNVNPNTDKQLSREGNDKATLEKQRRHDFNVIFIFAQSQEAHQIIPLLRYYYANDVPIYASSSVYSGSPNPTQDVDLNGVIVCDTPWNREIAHAGKGSGNRLNAVGQDAYLLSQTLPRLTALPNFPMYGSTGALVLSSNHQIHRRVPCTAIQNGLF